jgi:hypothetical protein
MKQVIFVGGVILKIDLNLPELASSGVVAHTVLFTPRISTMGLVSSITHTFFKIIIRKTNIMDKMGKTLLNLDIVGGTRNSEEQAILDT